MNSFFKVENNIKEQKEIFQPIIDFKLSTNKMTNNIINSNTINENNYSNEFNQNNYFNFNKNELFYTYLYNETDIELVDLLKSNLLKTVKAFQKAYYQEEIKGENIIVPSWRMKEKVFYFYYLYSVKHH